MEPVFCNASSGNQVIRALRGGTRVELLTQLDVLASSNVGFYCQSNRVFAVTIRNDEIPSVKSMIDVNWIVRENRELERIYQGLFVR